MEPMEPMEPKEDMKNMETMEPIEDFVPGRFWVFIYLGRFCIGEILCRKILCGKILGVGRFCAGKIMGGNPFVNQYRTVYFWLNLYQ